jgi:hypothetical protein
VFGVVLGVLLLNTTGWAVMLSMLMILISLIIFELDPLFFSTWFLITMLLAWAHREDLATPLRLNQKIKKILQHDE